MKFNHLNVPDHWQHYWTRYPEGYTILEALIKWVSQVDDMVDKLNLNTVQIGTLQAEIETKIDSLFTEEMPKKVDEVLDQWATDGTLDSFLDTGVIGELKDKAEQQDMELLNKFSKNDLIPLANFAQDAKEAMTGGSVAVVGDNTIVTSNIVDDQVTKEKVNKFLKDNHYQVEKYISKGVRLIDEKNLYSFKSIGKNQVDAYSVRVHHVPSHEAGKLTVYTRTHKTGTVIIHVMEKKEPDQFRKIASQTFKLDSGNHILETDLIIEAGQYVALESNENFYFSGGGLIDSYYLQGTVAPSTFTPFATAQYEVGYYYGVGTPNKIDETIKGVDEIITYRKPQGTIDFNPEEKRVTNDGTEPTTRVRDVQSQHTGTLELVIDLVDVKPFKVYVLNKTDLNFELVASEDLTPTGTGKQTFLTGLTIEKGQYVGIESKNNVYWTNTPSIHYRYVGEPILNTSILYEQFDNIEMLYYFNVVNIGKMEQLEKKIQDIEVPEPIERPEASYLYGKTLYMFGDSITYWDSPTINVEDRGRVYDVKGLGSYIRERLWAIVINHGIGGEVAKQITDRLVATDLTNVDAITYSSGSNDVAKGVVIGTIDDPTTSDTFYGNVKRAIENAYTQNPYIRIYLFTPHENFTGSRDVRPCVEAIVEIGKLYGIPVFNAFEQVQVNTINQVVYMVDKLHFNAIGYELFADSFIPFLSRH